MHKHTFVQSGATPASRIVRLVLAKIVQRPHRSWLSIARAE
jgi:hypothetical protein